ncbi:hypothetical protein QBC41DRAFT_95664 [Cercophora samala]|uniref:RING-type domain-containing protein n=1 Tax=Cercophora samala TaxID=330535 RepID=A0AA40DCT4_9PEZI|nr:hypothetical protein QBC41DRAFT_95664 [Cercophora samala]
MPAVLHNGDFDKDNLTFIQVILWAILQAMALAVVGHVTRGPTRPVRRGTTAVDDDPLRKDSPDEPPNLREKGKQVDIAVSLPEQAPTTWSPPPQLEYKDLDDGEHFLVDYPVPEALSSYPPELGDIPDTIRTVVRLSIDAVFERARLEKEAAVALAQRIARDNATDADVAGQEHEETATGNQQAAQENEPAEEGSSTETPAPVVTAVTAISPSIAEENQSPPSDTNAEPERPIVKPSRSWLRRVLSHRYSAPSVSPAGGRNDSQETPESPSSFTRFIFKTFIRPSDGNKGPEEEIECTACLEPISRGDSVRASICDHSYCKPCFEQLVLTGLQTEAQFPPKCCLNPIPCRTITKYASRSTRKLYTDKSAEYTTDKIYCPIPDCGRWHDKRAITFKYTTAPKCPNGHKMCSVCHQKAHKRGQYCPKDPDLIRAKAFIKEFGWQRCPKCHATVEHISGCRHMRCRCGGRFCYVCGAKWGTCKCLDSKVAEMKAVAAMIRLQKQRQDQGEPAGQAGLSGQELTPPPAASTKTTTATTLAQLTEISERSSHLTSVLASITNHQENTLTTAHAHETHLLQRSHSTRRRTLNQNHTKALTPLHNAHTTAISALREKHAADTAASTKEYTLKVRELYQNPELKGDALLERVQKAYKEHQVRKQETSRRNTREVGMLQLEQMGAMMEKKKGLMREREEVEGELGREARELRGRQVREAEWAVLVWEERGRMLREMEEREREVVILAGGES